MNLSCFHYLELFDLEGFHCREHNLHILEQFFAKSCKFSTSLLLEESKLAVSGDIELEYGG